MMNYYMNTALVFFIRIQAFNQNTFYLRPPRKAKEPVQNKVHTESTAVCPDIFHELNLRDYRGFVQRALQSYWGDIESCDNAGERSTLLQHGVRLMRKEMSAEADRLYTCYGYAIPDETRFKTELRGLAEKAVCQLQSSSANC